MPEMSQTRYVSLLLLHEQEADLYYGTLATSVKQLLRNAHMLLDLPERSNWRIQSWCLSLPTMCRMISCASAFPLDVTPSCLIALRKGVADELLTKTDGQRGRRGLAGSPYDRGIGRYSRSRSISMSSDSVSTISTNLSRSSSPRPSKMEFSQSIRPSSPLSKVRGSGTGRKRRRSSSTSSYDSTSSSSSHGHRRALQPRDDRNVRRRRSAHSPPTRGRDVHSDHSRPRYRSRSREDSMDRSQIARHRHSLDKDSHLWKGGPDGRGGRAPTSPTGRYHTFTDRNGRRRSNDEDHYGSNYLRDGIENKHPGRKRTERSLSPFSKRLALTQALNQGRL